MNKNDKFIYPDMITAHYSGMALIGNKNLCTLKKKTFIQIIAFPFVGRLKYWEIPFYKCYVKDRCIYAHPYIIDKIKEACK